jgi:hypothetical protein
MDEGLPVGTIFPVRGWRRDAECSSGGSGARDFRIAALATGAGLVAALAGLVAALTGAVEVTDSAENAEETF